MKLGLHFTYFGMNVLSMLRKHRTFSVDPTDVKRIQMADIWSFACLCLYIISGDDPKYYRQKVNGEQCLLSTYKNAFVAITLAVGSGVCSPEYELCCGYTLALTELFQKCFQFEAELRPSTTQLSEELLPACKEQAKGRTFVTTLWEDLVSFDLMQVLRRGTNGNVYLAQKTDISKRNVSTDIAVELMPLPADPTERSQLITECNSQFEAFKDLKHENVLRYIQCRIKSLCIGTLHNAPAGCYCVLMEHCPGGTLHEAVKISSNSKYIKKWAREICTGLRYLHDNGVVHRNLNGTNILLSCSDYEQCSMKISGMSCGSEQPGSRVIERNEDSHSETIAFMSPEILAWNTMREYEEVEEISDETDIWSFGCVVIQLCTGRIPKICRWDARLGYQDEAQPSSLLVLSHLAKRLAKPDIRELAATGTDHLLIQLVESCLSFEPYQRPTAAQLLRHKYFTNPA